ncbi:MAG: FecR family protein [Proteobacteria bacterium]|nr:FecR family protein [Pseudomonadota bacterium]
MGEAAMMPEEQTDSSLQEAMDWLLRVQADPALGPALDEWRAADPAHARAWEQASRTWELIGEIPPVYETRRESAEYAKSRRDYAAIRGHRRTFALGMTAAALAACLSIVVLSTLMPHVGADYATSTAELRDVALEDGSTVHLAPRSAIVTRFTKERRSVRLLDGEAFFEVAPNKDRPFVVEADGLSVTVVGTAFDVRMSADLLTVDVARGTVAVSYRKGERPLDTRLTVGDRVEVNRITGAGRQSEIPEETVASWRDHRLFVEGASVAQVVEELRRFQAGWIVIADSGLAKRRVTGLYDLGDPKRALRALVRPFGGRVRELTPLIHILSED